MALWWNWHCWTCGLEVGERPTAGRPRVSSLHCSDCGGNEAPAPSPFALPPITYRWTAEHRAKRRAEWREALDAGDRAA